MAQYPTDNKKLIEDNLSSNIASGLKNINNSLSKNISKIQADMASVPAKYNQLRNQLSAQNAKAKKQTEEYIANTGNHTASGFAMSKRLNNTNAFNKEMNNIGISEQSELAGLKAQIRSAYTDADTERNKLITEEKDKALERQLQESERYDKLMETMRVNDANILKINKDIELSESKDKREQEAHNAEMKYIDAEKQAEIDKIKADTSYTNAKASTETSRKALVEAQTESAKASAAKTASSASGSSRSSSSKSSSGGSSGGSQASSKLTPAQLADNITKQTGTVKYDSSGKKYYESNDYDAYILLMEWKKKFGLSNQVVNDTAIYLGIQSYL